MNERVKARLENKKDILNRILDDLLTKEIVYITDKLNNNYKIDCYDNIYKVFIQDKNNGTYTLYKIVTDDFELINEIIRELN